MLTFSILNQDHVMKDHADGQHMTEDNHMQKDHVVG